MNLFRLCNPFVITSQIKASKIQVQILNQDNSENSVRMNDPDNSLMETSLPTNTKHKPKLSLFRKSNILTLSDEIFSFVMDIRWNYDTYQEFEKNILSSKEASLSYLFEFTPASPKSILVKMLRQEFELNPNISFSEDDLDSALQSLTTLVENYFEFPQGYDAQSPYNLNCFTSLEYVYICTDVLLAAAWRMFLQQKKQHQNSTMCDVHIYHIQKLLSAVLHLFPLAGEDQRAACGVALCQILVKISQILHIVITMVQNDVVNVSAVFKAIDIVHVVQESLPIVASVPSCGEIVQYLLTMKLWVLLDNLLRMINRQIIFTSSTMHMLQMYKNKLWKTAIQLMSSSHALIGALQAQELQEVHPLSSMNEQGMERMIYDTIVSTETNTTHANMWQMLLAPPTSDVGHVNGVTLPWGLHINTSFYVRFLVMSMVKVANLEYYATSFRNKHLMQSCAALNMPPAVDQIMRVVYEVFVFTTKDKIVIERLFLAPTMAQLLLQLTALVKGHVHCQWIFWNLAKSLNEFNEWLKLRVRALRQRAMSTTSDQSVHEIGSGSGQGSSHGGSFHNVHYPQNSRKIRRSSSSSRGARRERKESDDIWSGIGEGVVTVTLEGEQEGEEPREEDEPEDEEEDTIEPIIHSLSASPSSAPSSRKNMMVSASAPGLLLPLASGKVAKTDVDSQALVAEANKYGTTAPKFGMRLPSLTSLSSSPPPPATTVQLFQIGDLVDGNVTLSNGTQRWFPGKVTAFHSEDSTYSIVYDDGDTGSHVSITNIRETKRRVRGSRNSNSAVAGESAKPIRASSDTNSIPILKPIALAFSNSKSNITTPSLSSTTVEEVPLKRSESPTMVSNLPLSDVRKGPSGIADNIMLSLDLQVKHVETDDEDNVSSHRLSFRTSSNEQAKVKNQNFKDDDDDEEDDDDNIFEIPSIFDQGHRVNNGSHLLDRDELVPRMQFASLPLASSGLHSAPGGLSLSAALLPDDETISSSFVETPSTNIHNPSNATTTNNSLYNMSALKVLSGRQTPSFVLQSHRGGGSVMNNAGALSTTRSMVATHRSLNNDNFNAAAYIEESNNRYASYANASAVSSSSTPSHLHIGNFHSALQQQQQQQQSPFSNNGYVDFSTPLPSNSSRVLTWRGSTNSMHNHGGHSHNNSNHFGHNNYGESPSSRLTSSRTMQMHGNTHAGFHNNSNNNSVNGSNSSRRPSVAPPDQLLTASHETRQHLIQQRTSQFQSGRNARKSLSRQNSSGVPASQQLVSLANLSPSKRGLLNTNNTLPNHRPRTASPPVLSATSSALSKQTMLPSQDVHHQRHLSAAHQQVPIMHTIPDETLLLEEQVAFRLLLQTYLLVSVALVDFSVHQEEYTCVSHDKSSYATAASSPTITTMALQQLKYTACVSQEHVSASTLAVLAHQTSNGHDGDNMYTTYYRVNLLFHVREFLELCPDIWKDRFYLGVLTVNNHSNLLSLRAKDKNADNRNILQETAFERVMNLLSPMFFPHEEMQKHMQTSGDRIGAGGFGSVFQIQIYGKQNGYFGLSHCLSCYVQCHTRQAVKQLVCNCWRSSLSTPNKDSNNKNSTDASTLSHVTMAVKCIPRERSMFDESMLFAIYQELTCLQTMQRCVGICGLEHFGVCGSEYWLIMEHGKQSLLDWRLQYDVPDPTSASPQQIIPKRGLQKKDLFVFLLLWQDVLLIVDALHRADIGHFDLKACNFILREDPRPYLTQMVHMHEQQLMSGFLFIADFGEAIPAISHPKNDSLRRRCRGTLAVQSPEMLRISEDVENTVGVHGGVMSAFGSSSKLSKYNGIINPVDKTKDAEPLTMLQQVNRHGALGEHIADHAHISLSHWIKHVSAKKETIFTEITNQNLVPSSTKQIPNKNLRAIKGGISTTFEDTEDIAHMHAYYTDKTSDTTTKNDTTNENEMDGIWQIARTTPISFASVHKHSGDSNATPSKPPLPKATIPRFSPDQPPKHPPSQPQQPPRLDLGLPTKRSDLWSLGSVFIELLTSKMLFEDAQWVELFSCLCVKPLTAQNNVLQVMKHHVQKLDGLFTEHFFSSPQSIPQSTEDEITIPSPNNSTMKKLLEEFKHLLQAMLQQRPEERASPMYLFQETERLLHTFFVAELTECAQQKRQDQDKDSVETKASTVISTDKEEVLVEEMKQALQLQHEAEEIILSSPAKSPKSAENLSAFCVVSEENEEANLVFWQTQSKAMSDPVLEPYALPAIHDNIMILDEATAVSLMRPLLATLTTPLKQYLQQVQQTTASSQPFHKKPHQNTKSEGNNCSSHTVNMLPTLSSIGASSTLSFVNSCSSNGDRYTNSPNTETLASGLWSVLHLQKRWQEDIHMLLPTSSAMHNGTHSHQLLSQANRSRCNSATSILSSGGNTAAGCVSVIAQHPPVAAMEGGWSDPFHTAIEAIDDTSSSSTGTGSNSGWSRLSVTQRALCERLYQRLRREVHFVCEMVSVTLLKDASTARTTNHIPGATNASSSSSRMPHSSILKKSVSLFGQQLFHNKHSNNNSIDNSSQNNNSMSQPPPHLGMVDSCVSGISLSMVSSGSNSISRTINNNNSSNSQPYKLSSAHLAKTVTTMQQLLMTAQPHLPASKHDVPNNASSASEYVSAKCGIVWLRICGEADAIGYGLNNDVVWDEMNSYGDSIIHIVTITLPALSIYEPNDQLWTEALAEVLQQETIQLQKASFVLVTFPTSFCYLEKNANTNNDHTCSNQDILAHWKEMYLRDTTESQRRHLQARIFKNMPSVSSDNNNGNPVEPEDQEVKRLTTSPQQGTGEKLTSMRLWWQTKQRQLQFLRVGSLSLAAAVSSSFAPFTPYVPGSVPVSNKRQDDLPPPILMISPTGTNASLPKKTNSIINNVTQTNINNNKAVTRGTSSPCISQTKYLIQQEMTMWVRRLRILPTVFPQPATNHPQPQEVMLFSEQQIQQPSLTVIDEDSNYIRNIDSINDNNGDDNSMSSVDNASLYHDVHLTEQEDWVLFFRLFENLSSVCVELSMNETPENAKK